MYPKNSANPSPEQTPHRRAVRIPFPLPPEPFHIVLVQPEIPPNTGNIARLCAATGTVLHLVEPLGFRLTDRALRRAGLDYWKHVHCVLHPDWDALEQSLNGHRLFLFSCGAPLAYTDIAYRPGDAFVFGSESQGLSESLLLRHAGQVAALPMIPNRVRSLNLATTAGIVLYEALRQLQTAQRPPTPPPP